MALYLLGDIQDMCKYHLSYGSGAVCGNIGNNDTAFFGSSRIDNVVSGSQYTDIFQFGQGSHVVCIDDYLVSQNYFCTG